MNEELFKKIGHTGFRFIEKGYRVKVEKESDFDSRAFYLEECWPDFEKGISEEFINARRWPLIRLYHGSDMTTPLGGFKGREEALEFALDRYLQEKAAQNCKK